MNLIFVKLYITQYLTFLNGDVLKIKNIVKHQNITNVFFIHKWMPIINKASKWIKRENPKKNI